MAETAKEVNLVAMNQEINMQLADETVKRALLATTFKGLQPTVMKQAILEGMIRGFTFKNFLEKDVYAVPYGSGYSITPSIDYVRKIGMRAGIIGKGAPIYEMNGTKIVSCSVTVKRKAFNEVGEYTSLVFFDEYDSGKNLWKTKPKTMLAKVAEMHALRMACPEYLGHAYIEEEMESEIAQEENKVIRVEDAKEASKSITMGAIAKKQHDETENEGGVSEEDAKLFQASEDREAKGS